MKNPGRLAKRAFAKSFAKRVNAEGHLKKAISKMKNNQFEAIENLADVPVIYHDMANKRTY